jgi:hypothetical protein
LGAIGLADREPTYVFAAPGSIARRDHFSGNAMGCHRAGHGGSPLHFRIFFPFRR